MVPLQYEKELAAGQIKFEDREVGELHAVPRCQVGQQGGG
jgi:hypothetical protein